MEAVGKRSTVKSITAADFRHLIQQLAEKRRGFKKLNTDIQGQVQGDLDPWDSLLLWVKSRIGSRLRLFVPFRKTLDWIDSQYGSDVYAYFQFVIWLVSFNILSFLVPFLIGLSPSMMYNDKSNQSLTLSVSKAPFVWSDILTGAVRL